MKPDFVDARIALTSVLLDARDYASALDVAKGLQRDYPESPLALRIEGTILTQAGRHTEAVAALEKAVELADVSDSTRQLAEAYAKAGRPKDAIKLLDAWLNTHADDRAAMAMLAVAYQTNGDTHEAIRLYESLYQADETNYLLLNNMARLYHQTGDPRAVEMARQAYEAGPTRPEIADTYGWILFSAGQKDKALSVLQQAYLAYPTQTEIGYHVAVALDAVGRNDEAVKVLRKLLRDNPGSPQATEAKALLDKLGG